MATRRTVWFQDDIYQELKTESKLVGMSVSSLICMKLRRYVLLDEVREELRNVIREELHK